MASGHFQYLGDFWPEASAPDGEADVCATACKLASPSRGFIREAFLQRLAWPILKVDALLLNDKRTPLHQRVDGADIFAQNANKNHLQGHEKEHAYDQRRLPCRKSLPIEQLVNEIGERDQYAKQCGGESGESHPAQGDLGKIGDPQHCQVIKGIEIVLGDSAFARRLVIRNFETRQSDFGNHAAKVGIRIVELLDDINYLAIVQAESCEVLNSVNSRQTVDQLIVFAANPEHDRVLRSRSLDADNDCVACFPLANHLN